jgi:hypothetical protein
VQELRAYANARSWEIVREFKDEGWRGTRADCPASKALMSEVAVRKFDVAQQRRGPFSVLYRRGL